MTLTNAQLSAAIRAGLPRERVLNAMTDAQLRAWSQARRARAASSAA